MGSLIYLLIFGASIFVMMRYGCGAHSDSRDAVVGPAVGLAAPPELAEHSRQLRGQLPAHRALMIPVLALGLACGLFLSISSAYKTRR